MPPLARLLLAIGAAVVPASMRTDWLREWDAELRHHYAEVARH